VKTATTTISTTIVGGTGLSSIDLDADNSSGAADPNFQTTWDQAGTTVLADTDATVGNDADTIQSITVKNNNRLDGTSEVLDATVSGGITKTFDAATGILTLKGPATPAQFIPVLRSVTYKNNAATINGTSRTFTFEVLGGTNVTTATTLISTTIGGGGGTSSVDLNGSDEAGVDRSDILWDKTQAVTLADTDALVTNTANSLSKIEVTITNRQDDINEVLSATAVGGVKVNYDAPSGVLTLTGPASPAEFQNVVRSVQYQNTATTPTGTSRSFQFEAFGGTQSAIATATITTTPGGGGGGGAGTVTLDLNGSDDPGMNYIVSSPLNTTVRATDTDATVDNRDNNGNPKDITKITVTISDRRDDLSEVLAAPGADQGDGKSGNPNVVASYDQVTGVLTLTGPASPTEFQAALRSVTYKNSLEKPTGTSRILEFRVFGGANSVLQTTTITTTGGGGGGTGVSNIDLNGSDEPGVDRSDILWDKTQPVTLADTDALVTNTANSLTKIEVTITDRQDDISEVLTATPAGAVKVSYDAPSGVLTLTGPASPAEFQNVVRSVQYQNTAATPTGTTRSIQFEAFGGTQSAIATATISTTPGGGGGGTSSIDLNGADEPGVDRSDILWDKTQKVTLADTDALVTNTANTLTKIEVKITNRQDDISEVLSATPAGAVKVSFDAPSGVLTLQGPATPAEFQNVVRSVQYQNTAATPTGTSRSFQFEAFGGTQNAIATANITTTPGDTGSGTATLDLNGANDPGMNYVVTSSLDTTVNVTDTDAIVDNRDSNGNVKDITKITVTISDRRDDLSEVLAAPGADKGDGKSGNPNVVASYNQGTGVLTLTGPASPAEFQAALRSITYTNNLETPTGTSRTLEFRVFGGANNVFQTTTITTTGGGDGGGGGIGISSIDLNGADDPGLNYVAKLVTKTAIPLTDTDATVANTSGKIKKIVITIQDRLDDLSEALSATNADKGDGKSNNPNVVASYDQIKGVLTLTGPATPAEFQFALRSVSYINNAGTLTGTSRNIEFRVIGGEQDVFANAILTVKGGGGGGDNVDTDGDGVPDSQDPDDDGDGIPDDQDNDSPSGGTGGDSDGSFGGVNARIDLNGSGAGYNFTTKWNVNGSTALASSDSTIKGNDMMQKLTISMVGGTPGMGTITAAAAGGLKSTYANGVLTLEGPASRQAFETTLRSVQYTSALLDTGNQANDEKLSFRFDLYGDTDDVDTLSSTATTTLDTDADPNSNNKIFKGTSSVVGDTATIVYRVRNTTGHVLNGITVKGKLSGGRPYVEEADFNASVGSVSAKFVTPDMIKRYLQPNKYGGRNVIWSIDSLDVNQEAVLTITVPLLQEKMGNKLTEDFTATFPNGVASETVSSFQAP
jgi:hypothetical protein